MTGALPSLATRRAYGATVYRVAPPDGPGLRIGRRDAGEEAWLERAGLRRAALMTACNPMSRLRPARLNAARLRLLAARVRAAGLPVLPSRGEGAGDWPPEPALTAAVATRGHALGLARRWRQHAIVWLEPGRAPRLLWCFAPRAALAARVPRRLRAARAATKPAPTGPA